MAGRFIKLYDKILKWEWYSDINTFRLFIHLLLKANYKDLKFEGKKILRGQLVTSLPAISSQTGLSVRQVRVSLDKLKMTGEVTSTTYPKYRVITITRYDEYQSSDRQDDSQMTGKTAGKRQANDRLMTGKRQANDRLMTASIDNIEQVEQIEKIEHPSDVSVSAKRFTPPTVDDVLSYCQEKGIQVDAEKFVAYYDSNGWMVGRNHMKNWQAACQNWARRDRDGGQKKPEALTAVVAQGYHQRDYSSEQDEALRRMMEMEV